MSFSPRDEETYSRFRAALEAIDRAESSMPFMQPYMREPPPPQHVINERLDTGIDTDLIIRNHPRGLGEEDVMPSVRFMASIFPLHSSYFDIHIVPDVIIGDRYFRNNEEVSFGDIFHLNNSARILEAMFFVVRAEDNLEFLHRVVTPIAPSVHKRLLNKNAIYMLLVDALLAYHAKHVDVTAPHNTLISMRRVTNVLLQYDSNNAHTKRTLYHPGISSFYSVLNCKSRKTRELREKTVRLLFLLYVEVIVEVYPFGSILPAEMPIMEDIRANLIQRRQSCVYVARYILNEFDKRPLVKIPLYIIKSLADHVRTDDALCIELLSSIIVEQHARFWKLSSATYPQTQIQPFLDRVKDHVARYGTARLKSYNSTMHDYADDRPHNNAYQLVQTLSLSSS
jgi:hypothetical protein